MWPAVGEMNFIQQLLICLDRQDLTYMTFVIRHQGIKDSSGSQ